MKTTFILLLALSLSVTAMGQNLVPNGNFESWATAVTQVPQYAVQTSNPGVFYAGGTTLNAVRTTDAYHGTYAIKLTTVVVAPGDTEPGFFVNGNASDNPSTWTGGIPVTESPTGITGYYKSAITGNDSALIILSFRKTGSNIGVYYVKLAGTHTAYAPFNFTFNPPLADTPDSVVIGAVSSDLLNNVAVKGSMIQLDSLSFTGVSAQPVEMNGDFELWQNDTLTKPDNWRALSLDQQKGVKQTTDAYGGSKFAVELTTLAGDNDGRPWAFPSQVAHYSPFSGLIDTLVFYYKYTAHGGDNGLVTLSFNKQGISIGGGIAYLGATANYQLIQIPIDLDVQPDTAVVLFQSSLNEDTLTSFVGSVLKVDSVHFKSQGMVGVRNYTPESGLFIYPNPSANGVFIINGTEQASEIWVYDMMGKEVKATIVKSNNSSLVRLPANTSGLYLVRVTTNDKIFAGKIIVNR